MWQNCERGVETEQDLDITLVGVKTRLNNSARTFFHGCRPCLSKTITIPLIFSLFSTKSRGLPRKLGHLKGVIFSRSYFPFPDLFLNGVRVHFWKFCYALNAFFYSVSYRTGRQGVDPCLMFHDIPLENFISVPIMDLLPFLF